MAKLVQLSFDFSEGAPLAKCPVISDRVAAVLDRVAAVPSAKVIDDLCAPAVLLDSVAQLDDAANRQGIASVICDPCGSCALADLCGHDDCAQHLFPLDVDYPNFGEWSEFVEESDDDFYS